MSVIDAVVWPDGLALSGLVAYHEGPVGPYRELFTAPLTPRGARVTLMAVDSERSVQGGRANWALPKELARFEADGARTTVTGEGWTVTVTTRARRGRFPAAGAFLCTQPWPDGVARSFPVTVRGRARLGSVEIEGRGRRPAVLFSGRQVVGPPAR